MLQMERYTLNYQLFKRNNMKKYLSLVMIGLSLMLSGCNKDDNHCSSGIMRMDEVEVLSFSILHHNLYIVVQSK